jgi:hypothetical protein
VNGIPRKDRNKKAWQSVRFVPIIGMVRDLIIPRLYQGLPASAVEGLSKTAQINEEAVNLVLDYDQSRMGLEMVLNKLIKDGFDYGLGIRKDLWRTETAENIPHTESFLDGMLKNINKVLKKSVGGGKLQPDQLLYDGPDCSWVDPFSFWWDQYGDSEESCAFMGEQHFWSMFKMRKDPRIDPECLEEVRKLETGDITEHTIKERLQALGHSLSETNRIYGKIKEGHHEVLEYWGTFDIDDDGLEEECRIMVIDRLIVGCCEQNPYWHGKKPYSIWQYDPINGQLVGRSMVARLKELQEEYNDATEQSSDMRKLTLKPMFKYRLGSDTNPASLQVAPGMPIGVENMEDVEWDRPPDFTQQLQAVLSEIREIVQLISGANDVALGQQDVGIGDNTATGASIAQEQTEMRFKQPAILLDLMMIRAGNLLISNEQQYRSDNLDIPNRDGGTVKWSTIRPEDLAGQFGYQMASGTLQQPNPQTRIQNLVNALKLTQGNQLYDPNKLIDQILVAMKVNPTSIKAPAAASPEGGGQLDKVAQLAALPPQEQQQFLATLNPQDRELMEKALAAVQPPNQAPPNGQPQQPQGPGPGNAQPQSQPGLPAPGATPTGVAAPQGA